ncbi:retrovirus-related pol polyprotein from transposon TNT 1-94 [Tanacetum coccineum]
MATEGNVPQLVDKKGGSYSAITPKLEPENFNKWKSDFQENSDDEANERSSEEYLTDIELEFYERHLLANSKHFIKRKNNFSSQKANEDTECYKCGKKGHFARDCFSKTYEPSYKSSVSNSSLVSKGFQPKFTPKLIQSSQHTQSSQSEAKFQKDHKAEYKKMKAKPALLKANEEEVFDDEEMTQVRVLMGLADDELTVGKNHACKREWIDITIRKLIESSSINDVKENPSIPASLDYDHEMVPKSKDWVKRHNPDSKLPNFNTRRIIVPKSQVVNECLRLTEATSDLQSSKEERPGLGSMKHTNPETQESLNKSILGPITVCDTELVTSLVPTEVKFNDQESKRHNHVILVRGGVLAESSQSRESSIDVSCPTYGSNVHSTTDHNDFKHFKRETHQGALLVPRRWMLKEYDWCQELSAQICEATRVFNTRRQQIKETYHVTFDESMEAIRQPTEETSRNNPKPQLPITEPICPLTCPHLKSHHHASTSSVSYSLRIYGKLVNIIGDPGEGMLTRIMAAKLITASASECLFVDEMQEELNQFHRNKVWTLVPLPYGKIAIGSKWVFKNKKDEVETIIRNKARLAAQGFIQEKGIDYDKTFAPVAMMEAIRIFLAFSTYMNCIDLKEANLKESYLIAMKRIFSYLKSTPSLGLWYPKCLRFNLKGYSDSDYGAKKQQLMAMSSTKAKYVAAAGCCANIL